MMLGYSIVMGVAWNHWYHVIINTYGSWLPGDPRGWRTRHLREQIGGDYKNPPKGSREGLRAKSRSLMGRNAVRVSAKLRRVILNAIVEKLRGDGVLLLAAASTNNLAFPPLPALGERGK
jgi:hypothetical protein